MKNKMSKNFPKISVIIPVYNMEKHLDECLKSLENQTFFLNTEVIIINDGSTDSSSEIIQKWSEHCNNVIIINQENKGAGYARNAGLKVASGEFVNFLDPDDMYPENDVLEMLYNTAIQQQVSICGGSLIIKQTDGTLRTNFNGEQMKNSFQEDGLVFYSDYQYTFYYQRFIYELSFIRDRNLMFPPYLRYQDPPFFVKACCEAGKFYALKKTTYTYREGNFKQIKWTPEKISGMMMGIKDVLNISNEYCYEEIHSSTIKKIVRYFSGVFSENLNALPDNFDQLVYEIIHSVNRAYISESEYNDFLQAGRNIFSKKQLEFRDELSCPKNNKEWNLIALCPAARSYQKSVSEEIKVSVIVPVYNVQKYIGACISSVIDQTLKEIECICVDDGTPDDSCSVIEQYMKTDNRIKLIHKQNGGLSSARNAGMKVAKGKYLYFLDSDDYLDPRALEVLYNICEKDKLDVLDFNATSFFETERDRQAKKNYIDYYKRNGAPSKVFNGLEYFVLMQKQNETKPAAWLHLISSEFCKKENIYFYEGILHEDNLFTYQLYTRAGRVEYIPDVFYHRRVHGESIMSKPYSEKNFYGYFITFFETLKDIFTREYTADEYTAIEQWLHRLSINVFKIYQNKPPVNLSSLFKDQPLEKAIYTIFCEDMNKRINDKANAIYKDMDKRLNEKINNIYKSKTWKVGKVVLYIPRKIKAFLKKMKKVLIK